MTAADANEAMAVPTAALTASIPAAASHAADLRRAPSALHAAWARPWMRPVAIGAGVLAAGLTGVAVHQAVTSSGAYGDAEQMIGADGVLRPGQDPSRYRELRSDGDRARRNALISAGAAAAFAATAGILGWASWESAPEAALAFRF